jgi:hypothetical protein
VSGNRNERTSNLSVIQPAAYSGVFRRIGIGTTLKFPDRRIARAADGIKRDAPGTPLVRLSTAGNESWGPVAGKDWMLQRVVYCCRGLSGTVCPIGGRDDGRSSMSKPGLDGRHRNKDGEISGKHGNTLVRTLRKVYGQGFAAGYPETAKLSEVMFHLNETSLSQLRRDHETDHLEHKISQASK